MIRKKTGRTSCGSGDGMQPDVHAARSRENNLGDRFLHLELRPISRPRPPFLSHRLDAVEGVLRQTASIMIVFLSAPSLGQPCHDPGRRPLPLPLSRLRRTTVPRRVPPLQPGASDEDHPAQHMAIIGAGLAMALGERGGSGNNPVDCFPGGRPQAIHPRPDQLGQLVHRSAPRRGLKHHRTGKSSGPDPEHVAQPGMSACSVPPVLKARGIRRPRPQAPLGVPSPATPRR